MWGIFILDNVVWTLKFCPFFYKYYYKCGKTWNYTMYNKNALIWLIKCVNNKFILNFKNISSIQMYSKEFFLFTGVKNKLVLWIVLLVDAPSIVNHQKQKHFIPIFYHMFKPKENIEQNSCLMLMTTSYSTNLRNSYYSTFFFECTIYTRDGNPIQLNVSFSIYWKFTTRWNFQVLRGLLKLSKNRHFHRKIT